MDDTISRESALLCLTGAFPTDGKCDISKVVSKFSKRIKNLPSEEPQIIHCKDCKHRPVVEEGYDEEEWDSGFRLDFPDNVCPCGCDDHFYNWLPKDDFYCGFAERMEVTE